MIIKAECVAAIGSKELYQLLKRLSRIISVVFPLRTRRADIGQDAASAGERVHVSTWLILLAQKAQPRGVAPVVMLPHKLAADTTNHTRPSATAVWPAGCWASTDYTDLLVMLNEKHHHPE